MKSRCSTVLFQLLLLYIFGMMASSILCSGNPIPGLPAGGPETPGISVIRFSPDGKYFATCTDDGSIDIWEFETGRRMQTFRLNPQDSVLNTFSRNSQSVVKTMFFDKSGRNLYALTAREGLFLKISLQPSVKSDTLATAVAAANLSPRRNFYALGMRNGAIRIFDANSDQQKYQLNPRVVAEPTLLVFNWKENGVAYSNERGKIVIQGFEGRINNNLTDKSARKTTWSDGFFNDNDKFLVTIGDAEGVYVWDVSKEKLKTSKPYNTTAVALLPNSNNMVVAHRGGLERVEIETLDFPKRFEVPPQSTVLTLDVNQHGDFFISGSKDGTSRVWNEFYGGALLSYHLETDFRAKKTHRIVVNSNRLFLPTDQESQEYFKSMYRLEQSDPDLVRTALKETLQKRHLAQQEDHIRREGKDYALLFAVNEYGGHWGHLKNPVRDAEALAEILQKEYGFNVEIVRNPDRVSIYKYLQTFRDQYYFDSLSQLFIFFSGHGHYIDATTEGFFIPADGKSSAEDPYQDSYIPHARLEKMLNAIPCPHILVAIDACYSGTFDEEIAALKSDDPEEDFRPGEMKGARSRFVERELRSKSRLYLTSGGKERTPDGTTHSPFVQKFLEALSTKGGTNKILTVAELYSYLESTNPKARKGRFGSSAPEGNFLFIAR